MLPIRLSLRNFLSYQQANIEFQGLHTICICGRNGAGKSSLLEAITWALWGQSRTTYDDELIHGTESEVQVDFLFQSHQQLYRVLRTHQRQQSTVLEFQVVSNVENDRPGLEDHRPFQFRSLTEKGLRGTQQRIIDTLKLDYDTFINSAYLRQGRADEFMLKRPSERKQVLADLLKLDQYDALAEKAKERTRQFNIQAQLLRENLQQVDQDLAQRKALDVQWSNLKAEVEALQHQQEQDQAYLDQLRQAEQQRSFFQHQRDRLQGEKADCQRALEAAQAELKTLEQSLENAEQITANYQIWAELRQAEEVLANKGIQFQALQQQRSQLQREYDRQRQGLEIDLQKLILQKEQTEQNMQTLEARLEKKEELQAAIDNLQTARQKLDRFDRLQAQAMPLKQRQQTLSLELQKLQAQVEARLTDLRCQLEKLQSVQEQVPQLEAELLTLHEQIEALDQLKPYRSQLREKGQERKNFLERLQAHQRDYEAQLQDLDQFQDRLEPGSDCPLCHRPLDEVHWEQVQHHQTEQRQDIVDMLLVLADQLMVSEREIQVLREEYRRVDQEINHYPLLTEQRGKLQQKLDNLKASQLHYQSLYAEFEELDRCQRLQTWNLQIQTELAQIEKSLADLNYDDRSHALARGEVDRWRWVDIRAAEFRSMEKELLKLAEQLPQLHRNIADLEAEKQALLTSENYQQIQSLSQDIANLDYDLNVHDRLRQQLRTHQDSPLAYQALQQAQTKLPQIQAQIETLQIRLSQYERELTERQTQLEHLHNSLGQSVLDFDLNRALEKINTKLQNDRQCLAEKLSNLGRLEQSRSALEHLNQQRDSKAQELESCHYQAQLYAELMQAFGKKGLQTLLIENLLPQLETETNAILTRLTSHQLHVQFITQRSSRRSAQDKLIDTLDIRIADIRGTRSYETFSGGEAFRVNFAIRLALARVLAQRSGSPLQLLIVDEGFGTQDHEGCDRLIAAINAIAQDFACILIITHMPQFKEAFQTRLEVEKTTTGSQIRLVL
ncbi:MAG: AAA family ATPase [Prochlorotrichaceae cyanobacterium]